MTHLFNIKHKFNTVTVLKKSQVDAGFISGYTGHVPVSRQTYGCSYIPKVNESMELFRGRRTELEKLTMNKFDQMGTLERSKTDILPRIRTKSRYNYIILVRAINNDSMT